MFVVVKKTRQKGDSEDTADSSETVASSETEAQSGRADDEL